MLVRDERSNNGIFWTDFQPATDQDRLDITVRALRHEVLFPRPVEVIPVSLKQAKVFVEHVHRHLPKVHAWKYGMGLSDEISLLGVVMVGRPVSRMLDDGETLEIIRCCMLAKTPRNAASTLLGRACRAGAAMGFRRMVTYTLAHEDGASLRAAGFSADGSTDGGQWSRPSRGRKKRPEGTDGPKTRWARKL
jgi:hypothetical protein